MKINEKRFRKGRYIEMIVIHCSHESETPSKIVLTINQGKQKICPRDLTWRSAIVYQQPENEKFGKQQIFFF